MGLGALPRLLRGARLGGPCAQPAQPLLVADGRPGHALVRHLHRGRRRDARAVRSGVVVVGHGMGGLLALKAAERMPGLRPGPAQLRAAARAARPRPASTSCARSRRSTASRPDRLGDAPRAPAARRPRPDPGRRPAGPAPARPEAARSRRCAPPDAGRACRSTVARSPTIPTPRRRGRARPDGPEPATRSGWPSGSTRGYEPFAAHSHYGLVVGENELPAGGRGDPGLPRDQPAVGRPGGPSSRGAGIMPTGPAESRPAPTGPHSSRGPGHRPLKAEITGSNPVCGTNP